MVKSPKKPDAAIRVKKKRKRQATKIREEKSSLHNRIRTVKQEGQEGSKKQEKVRGLRNNLTRLPIKKEKIR
jgi:hypothetical protein